MTRQAVPGADALPTPDTKGHPTSRDREARAPSGQAAPAGAQGKTARTSTITGSKLRQSSVISAWRLRISSVRSIA